MKLSYNDIEELKVNLEHWKAEKRKLLKLNFKLTSDGKQHKILGITSTQWEAYKNKIIAVAVELPFDYKECEFVP